MIAELRVLSGSSAGTVLPIPGKQFLIGRERDCHLRPDNELISRHHCVLRLDEYTLRVRDLGSRNGTFVNGQRIKGEVILRDGDTLFVGDLALQVRVVAKPNGPANNVTALDTIRLANANTEVFNGKTSVAPKEYPPSSALPADDPAASSAVAGDDNELGA